jgi:hypothetical protein
MIRKLLLFFLVALVLFTSLKQNISAQGNFSVGTRYYKWTDASRIDEHYGENELRSVHVQVWYPIESSKTNLKRADYFPEIEKAKPFLTNRTEEDKFKVKGKK